MLSVNRRIVSDSALQMDTDSASNAWRDIQETVPSVYILTPYSYFFNVRLMSCFYTHIPFQLNTDPRMSFLAIDPLENAVRQRPRLRRCRFNNTTCNPRSESDGTDGSKTDLITTYPPLQSPRVMSSTASFITGESSSATSDSLCVSGVMSATKNSDLSTGISSGPDSGDNALSTLSSLSRRLSQTGLLMVALPQV